MLLVVYYLLPLFLRLDDGQRSAFAEEEHGRDPAPYLIMIAKLQGTKRDRLDRLPQSRRGLSNSYHSYCCCRRRTFSIIITTIRPQILL